MIPRDRDLVRLGPWPLGANNLSAEHSVPRAAFREGVNVDVADDGKVSRRDGYTKVFDALEPHSAFGYGARGFYVEGTTLFGTELIGATLTQPLELYEGLLRDAPLAHCIIEPDIYVSDGQVALRISPANMVTEWAVPASPVPSYTVQSGGGLPAGRYQVATAFRIPSGEEGPLSQRVVIDVAADNSTIALSFNGFVPANADRRMIYLTKANGTELLLFGSVPVAAGGAGLSSQPRGRPAVSEFLYQMPAGRFAAYYAGRLLVAVEDMVVWSEPHQYSLTDPAYNYMLFSETVTGIGTAGENVDGFFVGLLSKTYFVSGSDPSDARLSEVYPAGMVPGTLVHVPGARLPLENPPTAPAPIWLATNGGVCAGLQDGTVLPLTEARFAADVGSVGAGVFEQRDGLNRYVVTTQNPNANVFAVQDQVSIEVVRNGITP